MKYGGNLDRELKTAMENKEVFRLVIFRLRSDNPGGHKQLLVFRWLLCLYRGPDWFRIALNKLNPQLKPGFSIYIGKYRQMGLRLDI